jgi:hypothetical protein
MAAADLGNSGQHHYNSIARDEPDIAAPAQRFTAKPDRVKVEGAAPLPLVSA